jgi:2-(1,2-epoxy-1,2-dihydrophenyl)acetyl-CoA isomerase
MVDAPAPVRALYDAMAVHDGRAIHTALHPEFVGEVTDGMPLGAGGVHLGPDAMLAEVWGPVFVHYDIAVEPRECLRCGPEAAVVIGRYRGSGRATGSRLDAAFAHVFELRDGRVSRLRQFTDSAAWWRAAGVRPAA